MQNFKDIVRIFVSKDAAVQVKNVEGLEHALGELLADPGRRDVLGRRAREIVSENLGAVERTMEMILPELARRKMYIVPKD
jgi:3-deoxy-D-manno-octulosonic-acid transferase